MKFDKYKAFPYPVLRPESDDYVDVDIQTTVDLNVGEELVTVLISFVISADEILDEIKKGNARYVSIISCRDTYFSKIHKTTDNEQVAEFKIDDLRGEIQINPYIVVTKEIPSYSSSFINPEFGAGPFKFSPGDILAQDEPQIFYVDKDVFRPVTSVFDLVKKDTLEDKEWAIGFSEDHIQIEVSPKMKSTIDDARNNNENKVILMNSIYFAAVMQSVQKLKESDGDYEGLKWAEVISRQAHNKGCDLPSEDAYFIAERLMEYPLSLLDTYIFKRRS